MTRHAAPRPWSALLLRGGLASLLVLVAWGGAARSADAVVTEPAASVGADADRISSRLLARAARDGRVPVIVRLAVQDPREVELGARPVARARTAVRATADAVLDDLGHRPVALKTASSMPLMAFHATADELETLASNPLVESVVEDVVVSVAATSTRGAAGGQQLKPGWDFKRVRAGTAHANGVTGNGQYVAVLDTGVDVTNPLLANDVVVEACFATGLSGLGECPNGGLQQVGVGAATPCEYTSSCAHGTHVAHTAVGRFGVAKGAQAIAVNVFHREDNNGQPTTRSFTSDQIWALSMISQMQTAGWSIAAVNMSLAGGSFSSYCDTGSETSDIGKAIDYLRLQGITTVVSTGNDDNAEGVGQPSCFRGALSVGNTTLTKKGKDAVFGGTSGGSNSAPPLDILAPGTDICSAVPASLDDDGSVDGWQCGWIGTSMAAPQVAGALALLRQLQPTATPDQMEIALKGSGPAVKDSRNGIVRKRLDVWQALNQL